MTKQEFKELRIKCELTYKSCAELLGVSERMIYYKENNPHYRITLRDKKALENYYEKIKRFGGETG